MSYNRRANNIGLSTNVGLDSSSISSSNPSINNNIVINGATETNNSKASLEHITERNASGVENPYVNYPSVSNFTPQNIPHMSYMPPLTKDNATLESKLLDIFTEILLSDNKRLLANIVSKQKIILSKADLESVVSILVESPQGGSDKKALRVNIELEDPNVNCLSRLTSALDFGKISAIKIIDEDVVVDFKLVHNKEYNDLTNKYHLSLKYIII